MHRGCLSALVTLSLCCAAGEVQVLRGCGEFRARFGASAVLRANCSTVQGAASKVWFTSVFGYQMSEQGPEWCVGLRVLGC